MCSHQMRMEWVTWCDHSNYTILSTLCGLPFGVVYCYDILLMSIIFYPNNISTVVSVHIEEYDIM